MNEYDRQWRRNQWIDAGVYAIFIIAFCFLMWVTGCVRVSDFEGFWK